jgi:hypothetical protein
MVVCGDDGMRSRDATFPRFKGESEPNGWYTKHNVRVRVLWCARQISSDKTKQTLYQHRTSMAVAVTILVSPTWM